MEKEQVKFMSLFLGYLMLIFLVMMIRVKKYKAVALKLKELSDVYLKD